MTQPLILASGSETRADMLRRACVAFESISPKVDEDTLKATLLSDSTTPRDVADAIAGAKTRKVAMKHPDRMVLGCDQVLDASGTILSKPATPEEGVSHLQLLRGTRHSLLSAAVIYEDGKPVWRHVGQVDLWMRDASDAWIDDYVSRNWQSIRHSVGCYKLEEEGVRLFTRIDGDHFNVLGMPLLEILSYLTLKGTLPA